MRSRRQLENEVTKIRKQVKLLKRKTVSNNKKLSDIDSDKVSSNLLTLIKFLVDENKKTTMLLQTMSTALNKIDSELSGIEEVEEIPQTSSAVEEIEASNGKRELAVSGIDAGIIELIQRSPNNMVCADDVKDKLHYKGRNAACTRLNKLYKAGVLDRYQLGHKVYYKFDAGKATKLLILSPPQ
jgi:hypothetical protein